MDEALLKLKLHVRFKNPEGMRECSPFQNRTRLAKDSVQKASTDPGTDSTVSSRELLRQAHLAPDCKNEKKMSPFRAVAERGKPRACELCPASA
mmetsp:Transcript_24114/g.39281  ORF Transcript_24114/g.39281 Transcript_24114/m.39281 type:complete len:94 (-) Transcript_24114:42-323(-)